MNEDAVNMTCTPLWICMEVVRTDSSALFLSDCSELDTVWTDYRCCVQYGDGKEQPVQYSIRPTCSRCTNTTPAEYEDAKHPCVCTGGGAAPAVQHPRFSRRISGRPPPPLPNICGGPKTCSAASFRALHRQSLKSANLFQPLIRPVA